jgi:hypothetical protein
MLPWLWWQKWWDMLVIHNVVKHILYICICWFYNISLNIYIKYVDMEHIKLYTMSTFGAILYSPPYVQLW